MRYLELKEIKEIHFNQINLYGGLMGIRDEDMLESAISQPKATYSDMFLHKTIFQKAAAYLFHIVQNHPFVDGNKRTGLACAIVFLYLNGYKLNAAQKETFQIVMQVAQSKCSKDKIAKFLKENSIKF